MALLRHFVCAYVLHPDGQSRCLKTRDLADKPCIRAGKTYNKCKFYIVISLQRPGERSTG